MANTVTNTTVTPETKLKDVTQSRINTLIKNLKECDTLDDLYITQYYLLAKMKKAGINTIAGEKGSNPLWNEFKAICKDKGWDTYPKVEKNVKVSIKVGDKNVYVWKTVKHDKYPTFWKLDIVK